LCAWITTPAHTYILTNEITGMGQIRVWYPVPGTELLFPTAFPRTHPELNFPYGYSVEPDVSPV